MKKRYYLRGLGLGILVTAVFFLLGDNSGKTMSDEMIKERAKELGMVESTVLAQINTNKDETVENTENVENVEYEMTTEEIPLEETSEVLSEMESVTEIESVTEELSTVNEEDSAIVEEEEVASTEDRSWKVTAEGQMISFNVYWGEFSGTVCLRLYDAGLVDDAHAFNVYLMQYDLDNHITAGVHMIPVGASWEEIAQILCS